MKHPKEWSYYGLAAGELQEKKQVVYTSESPSTEVNDLNVKAVSFY